MTKLADILNKVFNDEKLEEEILSFSLENQSFSILDVAEKYGSVLGYYLLSKDNSIRSLDYIQKEYYKLYNEILTFDRKREVVVNGYLTNSFNASEKEFIERYGYDFLNLCPKEERKSILNKYLTLCFLENNIRKSTFVDEKLDKFVFLTTPGAKTMKYLYEASPERLFLGPLSQSCGFEEPIIVGELSQEYYLRVLKRNLDYVKNLNSEEKKLLELLGNLLINNYCLEETCFSLIKVSKRWNKPVGLSYNLPLTFEDYISDVIYENISKVRDFFTFVSSDIVENDLDDLVAYRAQLDTSVVEGIVTCKSSFAIKQKFAKMRGYKDGDVMSFGHCYPNYSSNLYKGRKI